VYEEWFDYCFDGFDFFFYGDGECGYFYWFFGEVLV